jgi:hypothetical protein
LAKESKRTVISVNDETTFDDIVVVLDDVTEDSALFTVRDVNNETTKKIEVNEGDSETININGNEYKIRVYKTAYGVSKNVAWADVLITKDEFELENGDEYNDDWKVYLLWKNDDELESMLFVYDKEIERLKAGEEFVFGPYVLKTALSNDDLSDLRFEVADEAFDFGEYKTVKLTSDDNFTISSSMTNVGSVDVNTLYLVGLSEVTVDDYSSSDEFGIIKDGSEPFNGYIVSDNNKVVKVVDGKLKDYDEDSITLDGIEFTVDDEGKLKYEDGSTNIVKCALTDITANDGKGVLVFKFDDEYRITKPSDELTIKYEPA